MRNPFGHGQEVVEPLQVRKSSLASCQADFPPPSSMRARSSVRRRWCDRIPSITARGSSMGGPCPGNTVVRGRVERRSRLARYSIKLPVVQADVAGRVARQVKHLQLEALEREALAAAKGGRFLHLGTDPGS